MMKPYKLMCSLFAHTADVKGLCATRDKGGFVSVSRDLSAKLWHCSSENSNQYILAQTINAHKKYVNSVVVVYSVEGYPNGLIITGSNDQIINIHDIESNKTIAQLREHEGPVCTLFYDNNSNSNLLFSGSFDCTAKVWDLNNLVKSDFQLKSSITIKGHDLTVWSVIGIDKKGLLLTGSADKSIKHWKLDLSNNVSDCLYKYVGHSDCVRGLALSNVNDQEFFSCSNDGNVLQWKLYQTSPLRTIRVTDSFLYSINMINNQDLDTCYFLTSGEDRSLRIHLATNTKIDLVQTIVLPCQTLWNAICLSNGNLVVACSDGSIRLFTQDERTMANKTEQEEYEKELSQFAIPVKTNQQMSQINISKLPGIEALSIPGKQDGQNLIINNQNEAEVYQWDSTENRWIKIGVAVGSADTAGGSGSRQKVQYLGKEYDYVFDIELDDSGPKLKLPYNLSEDPYHAAQNFIHKHELSQMFLDEIASFIIKNTESQTIGSSQPLTYFDPFTGQNRYVPPTASINSSTTSSYGDPFTGSNAYTTNSVKKTVNENFEKTKSNSVESNEYYPHLNYILFEQVNIEPIVKKLRELQKEICSSYSNYLITESSNVELIENLVINYNKSKIGEQFGDQIDLLFQMIDVWPQDKLFPLVDIVRILALNQDFVTYLCRCEKSTFLTTKQAEPNSNQYFNVLFKLINGNNLVNAMLVTRVLCNLFKSLKDLKSNTCLKVLSFILNERSFLINKFSTFLTNNDNKALQISYSTLLLNYSILFKNLVNLNEYFSTNYITELILEMIEYLNDTNLTNSFISWDSEALFRILVTVGTLIAKSDNNLDNLYILTIAKSLQNFKQVCELIQTKSQKHVEKVVKCAYFLNKLL